MSKTGVYAIIRLVFMIFGLATNKPVGYLILIWGLITMVIGVSMALLQHDFKRLLAFHSVSQIGYIITALGMAIIENSEVGAMVLIGGIYHMINHAVFKGLLFLVAGAILYITGTTDLDSVSGLGKKMPFTMAMFLFGAAAISGIPPFNGFASKWIIYEAGFNGGLGIASIIAIVVSALTLASFIKVGHSIFFGPQKNKYKNINYDLLMENLTVNPIANTQIIEIKYKSLNPQQSYDLLYSITENLISYSKELYPNVNITVLEQVHVNLNQLMNKKLTIIGFGLILGLIVGIGGIIGVMYLNNTYKNQKSLEEEIGLTVIGVIPKID